MPIPTDEVLYNTSKIFIMSKYKKNSPLASGAIVKHYKQLYKKKHINHKEYNKEYHKEYYIKKKKRNQIINTNTQ